MTSGPTIHVDPANITVVVLAGGRATRMGGVDKACVDAGGHRLIDRVLSSVAGFPVVVVSSRNPTIDDSDVRLVAEDPPFSGPVPASARGVAEVETEFTFITTVDAPRAAELLPQLAQALGAGRTTDDADHSSTPPYDAAVIRSSEGFLEPLIALWRTAALRLAARGDGAAKRIYDGVHYAEVAGDGREKDFDTLEAVASEFGK